MLASDNNSATDGRNATLTFPVTTTGTYYARILSEAATSGEYTLVRSTTAPVATVTGFTVNGGNAQRSRITTITVDFSSPVTAANFNSLGAIQLKRTGLSSIPTGALNDLVQTGPANNSHITVTQGTASSLVLTFENNGSFTSTGPGVENGSLTDGYWQLILGSYTSTVGDVNLRRLYGDSTSVANGVIDGADLTSFGNAFNSANAAFDFDNNGVVDGADLSVFGNRFGNLL